MKRNMKRKGFTLVELLIVIVVIGILSAMMMLSSTEAVTSAKASNIISNLRNLKTAALAYYVDHLDDLEDSTKATTAISMNDVAVYLNSSKTSFNFNFTGVAYAEDAVTAATTSDGYEADGITYKIATVSRNEGTTTRASQKWYLMCDVNDTKVQEKLAGRAKSVGLLKGMTKTDAEGDSYTKQTTVYYLVR
ncbi:MAG: type II secretion system protein [Synergistaceae bacterium]|nr:type II secretion system protein [Synergistaceae bacterium]MBQ3398289.1 type II secretion system protein [Synergistaceae bacterium]MBQ6418688.1 type II secretion system protein [Synergistaceae bacterium]